MRRLALPDAAWLLIESPERPMHVGGIMLFEPPEAAPPTWVQDVVGRAFEHTEVRPPMNRRLSRPYGLLGSYAWAEDEVDLSYHVRHLALPAPGRIRELFSLVSRLHGSLLDRHRPLWELYLVEGLADGRVALYGKFHHSMMDGVAAIRQILSSFSFDAAARDLPPPWAARAGAGTGQQPRERPATNPLALTRTLATGVLAQAWSSVAVARAFAQQIIARLEHEAEVVPFEAPGSMLNVPLTGSRRIVAQSYDFGRIRAVATAADVTVNDVVLAMCGGALRAYLESHDALPDRPLIAFVPVNIRDDESGEGNAITFMLANLATHLADPGGRLALVHASTSAAKARLERMSRTDRLNYGIALSAPLILGQLTGLSRVAPPLFNVVVSNVPGPPDPLYWNGAKLDGLYPASLLTDGFALNISQTSYAGSMDFGITADRKALPRIQRLIDHLADALADLEKATGA